MRWEEAGNTAVTINETIRQYGSDILAADNFKKSAKNIQHGKVSVMRHSIDVARMGLIINRSLHLNCEEKDLVRGALLHDYFQYDWHNWSDPRNTHAPLHGFYHPGIALKNALREFPLTEKEQDIIKKHMWPMTVIPPACREAWVITLADKYVSARETVRGFLGV